jgi:transposase
VWRALPADFPPAGTVYYWAAKWQADGSTEAMHSQLRDQVRQVAGRKTAPTAAIIDSQSVKAAEEVARTSRGYDAGKKINGRKRHIAVDVMGLLLTVLITAASIQDRDAAKPLLWNLKMAFPAIRLAWADGGYAGKLVTWAKTALKLTLEIVKRPDDLHTFKVLPRRWVVERTLAWITRHRRTVRDYERLPDRHETYVYWAMIIVMTRRLARTPKASNESPQATLVFKQALRARPACCATCRPIWARRRSPPSSTSRRTRSRPTCSTCTGSSARTAAGRPCSAPGPSACSPRPPAGPRTPALERRP